MFQKSFLILSALLSVGSLSSVVSAESNNATSNSKYKVNVYECDKDLEILSVENRQKKIQGVPVRLCLAPNSAAQEDGIGIERIDSWVWETTFKGGASTQQQAVTDGVDDGVLSSVRCQEDRKVCVLDTMLTAKFYQNSGSVYGIGEATFTQGAGTVPINKDIFQVDFEFKFTHGPGGDEMSPEETQELLQAMSVQNAEAAAAAAAAAGAGAASTEL